ncbi:MAG: LemA family protein [Crocinitomicaceae bacterium]|nr:LemA family protein [Crocinitomicaceae bacterium]
MYILIGIAAFVVLILILLWVIYNGLVKAKNIVDEAFSGIDVQLMKRHELIPNLIEAVKGYNAHEAEVLTTIVGMRNSRAATVNETAASDGSITSALKSFRIQVEAYPDLQANTQFIKLMDNLTTVEDELAMARRYYNGTIREYNTKIEVFPAVMFAKMFGFTEAEFYEIENSSDREAPKVELNN